MRNTMKPAADLSFDRTVTTDSGGDQQQRGYGGCYDSEYSEYMLLKSKATESIVNVKDHH